MERIGEIVANIEQLKELVLHFEHQVNLLRFDIVMAGPRDWAPLDLNEGSDSVVQQEATTNEDDDVEQLDAVIDGS